MRVERGVPVTSSTLAAVIWLGVSVRALFQLRLASCGKAVVCVAARPR